MSKATEHRGLVIQKCAQLAVASGELELAARIQKVDDLHAACEAALVKFNGTPLDKVSVAADMLREAIAAAEGAK